ncbi:hypothetical protein ACF2G4_22840 (plasmid) [Pantoea sp. C3]|uniref:hypothetical protein n=1 Tax=Pantoea phytostimulans TaxID=2769024 RepID=UPI0038F80A1C
MSIYDKEKFNDHEYTVTVDRLRSDLMEAIHATFIQRYAIFSGCFAFSVRVKRAEWYKYGYDY